MDPNYLTIHHLISEQAAQTPNAIALTAPERPPLTYQHLKQQIDQVLRTLMGWGLGRGDRIAVVLPNGPEMAVAFLAIAACATCAPLNPAYRAEEFDFYLSDLQAKALVVPAGVDSAAIAIAQAQGIAIVELAIDPAAAAGVFSLSMRASDLSPGGGDFEEQPLESPLVMAQTFAQRIDAPVDTPVDAPVALACPDDIALVLHTSGTTARPKIVPLTHTNLCTSAHHIGQTLALTERDCCLNIMPLFHIHGLIGVLLSSLAAGGQVVCSPGFNRESFFAWLATFQPTWYSAVPTMHQTILAGAEDHTEITANSPLRFIRSSSASLSPATFAALEQTFSVPVIEAYGMTEAAHQMASNPLSIDSQKPGSVGRAAGPEVAIMNEAGDLLKVGEIGEVVIRGANVTLGYENNPAANASAFTRGWFRTGDQGYFDSDGYLFLRGRLKEIINRGGEKIAPLEVDAALMELPEVFQAVTFAVPHPSLGEDVAAAVVLRENGSLSTQAMREFLFQCLADFKVPSQIVVVDAIPKGPTGKLQRIGLAEKLADQLRSLTIAPRNDVEQAIADIFAEVLQITPPGVQDNFFVLGGDSLKGTQVANRLGVYFGLDIPNVLLFRKPTIAELADEIFTLIATSSEENLEDLLVALENVPEEELQNLLNSVI